MTNADKTDTSALQTLADKVEAGNISTDDIIGAFGNGWDNALVLRAFDGDLNAAKALHEAVVPNRSCGITFGGEYGATVTFPPTWDDLHLSQSHLIPARAWLLAIIRALIAGGRK